MANFSFDIVSEVDLQEVDNAANQAKKELAQRYDFKNSKSTIDFKRDEKKITLIADDDFKLRALQDILVTRLAKRGISHKSLIYKEPEKAFEGTLRQAIEIATGIPQEKTKELNKIIKDLQLKVQTQIEGEKMRVSSPKKDDLQAVMAAVRAADFDFVTSFTNYR